MTWEMKGKRMAEERRMSIEESLLAAAEHYRKQLDEVELALSYYKQYPEGATALVDYLRGSGLGWR